MTFEIKVKVGFFKTQPYQLTFGPGQIILTPLEDIDNGLLVIKGQDLKSVSIMRRMPSGEIEIATHSNTFIGTFNSQSDLEDVAKILSKGFSAKFTFHNEKF